MRYFLNTAKHRIAANVAGETGLLRVAGGSVVAVDTPERAAALEAISKVREISAEEYEARRGSSVEPPSNQYAAPGIVTTDDVPVRGGKANGKVAAKPKAEEKPAEPAEEPKAEEPAEPSEEKPAEPEVSDKDLALRSALDDDKLNRDDVRAELKARDLPAGGNKAEMVARLLEHLDKEASE